MTAIAEKAEDGAKKLAELSTTATALTKGADDLETAAAMRTTPGGPDGLARLTETAANLGTLAGTEERLQASEKETNKALDVAQKRRTKAISNLAAVEENHGRAGRHEVVAEQLRQLGELIAEQPRHEEAATNSKAAVTKLRNEFDAATSAATTAQASADTQREVERRAQEKATAATTALLDAERVVEAAEDAVARMGRHGDQVAAAYVELGTCGEELAKTEKALAPVADERDGARPRSRGGAAPRGRRGCGARVPSRGRMSGLRPSATRRLDTTGKH